MVAKIPDQVSAPDGDELHIPETSISLRESVSRSSGRGVCGGEIDAVVDFGFGGDAVCFRLAYRIPAVAPPKTTTTTMKNMTTDHVFDTSSLSARKSNISLPLFSTAENCVELADVVFVGEGKIPGFELFVGGVEGSVEFVVGGEGPGGNGVELFVAGGEEGVFVVGVVGEEVVFVVGVVGEEGVVVVLFAGGEPVVLLVVGDDGGVVGFEDVEFVCVAPFPDVEFGP